MKVVHWGFDLVCVDVDCFQCAVSFSYFDHVESILCIDNSSMFDAAMARVVAQTDSNVLSIHVAFVA